MSPQVKNEINYLIRKHSFVMFEFVDGQVKWMMNHHRFLDPEDAPRVIIGRCEPPKSLGLRPSNRNPKSKIIYLTHTI